ncbi:respiratory nitrate reductase subunit gamma [Nocardia sp. NPDC052566]|uniref:respiratory nitrate reductase subunit gamma n=1 Tax=Nocardia sp. NPDC052566 TaxID=3364330 RepID=UPI0037C5E28A
MTYLLWIFLPYSAFLSFVLGHVWRFRHDRFRADPYVDEAQRLGLMLFRAGVGLVLTTRIVEIFTTGPHTKPEGAPHVALSVAQMIALPLATIGAGLLLIPPLIAAGPRPAVTPVDRLTLPVLLACLATAVIIEFDPNSTDIHYRTAETLFTWFRSLLVLHPNKEAMRDAPFIYQARALILLLLIGIWPYTRLAGTFAVPALRLLRRSLMPRAARPRLLPSA